MWGVESMFRKCSAHAAAMDPHHSFVPNVVVLLLGSQLRELPEVVFQAASICLLIDHLSSGGLPVLD